MKMLDKPQAIALIRHIQRMLNAAKTGQIPDTDAQQLCEFWPLAGESFVHARWLDDVKAVGVRVQHNPPVEHDRLMDALFFAAVTLKCLPRGKVNFEPTTSNGKKYLYPRYEHPHDKSGGKRIRLIRIIADAPPHQAVMFTNTHYDLRLASLKLRAPIPNMQEPTLGRPEAIKLARELYEANHPAGLEYLSPGGFEAFLTEVLSTATAYHGPRDGKA